MSAAEVAAWKQAVANEQTILGFAEWATSALVLPSPNELADAFRRVSEAKADLRELVRPFAVAALGDWAADDETAHRNARSWAVTADVSLDGTTVCSLFFRDILHATGHNDTETVKSFRWDL